MVQVAQSDEDYRSYKGLLLGKQVPLEFSEWRVKGRGKHSPLGNGREQGKKYQGSSRMLRLILLMVEHIRK
jgi:hypothetical protein